MIFARRALQRRLNELRDTIGDEPVDRIVARLNVPGKDRIAAMWEVVVFHGLAATGKLESERALPTGRRPDVWFDNGEIQFVADVTSVSDDGLDDQNPYAELAELVEKAKAKLKLPIGGLDIHVHSREEEGPRGHRTVLKLPPRTRLSDFVRDQVAPELRKQLAKEEKILNVTIDDEDVGIDIVVDPSKSPYTSCGFAAYDVPTIRDRNPLYNALKGKANQLRGAQGVSGIIVGDGDCAALAERQATSRSVTPESIAQELLRQYSSLDFVLLITVREDQRPMFPPTTPTRRLFPILVCRNDRTTSEILKDVFREMLNKLPRPVRTPINGALRAREADYEMGHHGGFTLSGPKIRVSSRELIEVLAGLRTLDDNGARNVEAVRRIPGRPNEAKLAFLRQLQEGRLPIRITVENMDENDDDGWIEFEFGDPDPAIAPFK
jgi:hypothetical protein